jgi:hypothetical protein
MADNLIPVYPRCLRDAHWNVLKSPEIYFTDHFLLMLASRIGRPDPNRGVGFTLHLHGGATISLTTEQATYSNESGVKVEGLVTVRYYWPEGKSDHDPGDCTWKLLNDSHCEHLDSKLGVTRAVWPD